MALSADAIRNTRGAGNRQVAEYVIGTGKTIYLGSLVALEESTGRAEAATAATGKRIAGVAVEFVANAGGSADGVGDAAGTESVRVAYGDEHEFTVAAAIRTNTSLGLNVFVSDDDTVAGTAVGTAGTRLAVGELVGWVDTDGSDKSLAYVAVRRFASTNIAV